MILTMQIIINIISNYFLNSCYMRAIHYLPIAYCSFSLFGATVAHAQDNQIDKSAQQTANNNSVVSFSDSVVTADREKKPIEEQQKQQGLAVDVIKTDKLKNSNTDVSKVLKTKSGVHIRQAGGIGSESKLALNGISGNKIRYFVDGMPLENFGSATGIGNLGVNNIDKIEVFKGVVPIELGADALGGAINLSSFTNKEEQLDISHSYGSFDTHRFALTGQYITDNDLFMRANAYVNDSANDYKMYGVPMSDSVGNRLDDVNAKRFHDDYRSKMLSLQLGVMDKGYADELSVKLQYADNHNNMQHPTHTINRPLGEVYATNETWQASGHYKKNWDDAGIKAYLLTGYSENEFSDLASKRYNWAGNHTKLRENEGELGTKSLFISKDNILKGNLFGFYQPATQHKLSGNISFNHVKRDAEDKVNRVNTSFTEPNRLNKYVLATAYHWHSDKKRLNANLFYKHYRYNAKITNNEYQAGGNVNVTRDIDKDSNGFGFYGSYKLTPKTGVNASFERAYRLPETNEVLGDGEKYVRANPLLNPEVSNNYNLGLISSLGWGKTELDVEANGFYRQAQDYIKFYADRVIQGIYLNLDDVTVSGIELSANANYDKKYIASVSVTSQTLTDKSKFTPENKKNNAYNTDLPNEPKLFADLSLGYQNDLTDDIRLSVMSHNHFTDEFPVNETKRGSADSKSMVPLQISHDLEVGLSHFGLFDESTVHFSLLFENISDERLYDNFEIQKPGRAYYAKVRYEY